MRAHNAWFYEEIWNIFSWKEFICSSRVESQNNLKKKKKKKKKKKEKKTFGIIRILFNTH